jgi:hypothetical protein
MRDFLQLVTASDSESFLLLLLLRDIATLENEDATQTASRTNGDEGEALARATQLVGGRGDQTTAWNSMTSSLKMYSIKWI